MGFAEGLRAGSQLGLGIAESVRANRRAQLDRQLAELEAKGQFGRAGLAEPFLQERVTAEELGVSAPPVQQPDVFNPLAAPPEFVQSTDQAKLNELLQLSGSMPNAGQLPQLRAETPGILPADADTGVLDQLRGLIGGAVAGRPPVPPPIDEGIPPLPGEEGGPVPVPGTEPSALDAPPPPLPSSVFEEGAPVTPGKREIGKKAPKTVDQAAANAAKKAPLKERANAPQAAESLSTAVGESVAEMPVDIEVDLSEIQAAFDKKGELVGADAATPIASFGFMENLQSKLQDNFRLTPRVTEEFLKDTFGMTEAEVERFKDGNLLFPTSKEDEEMLATIAAKITAMGSRLKKGETLTLPEKTFGTKSWIAQRELLLQAAKDNLNLEAVRQRFKTPLGGTIPRTEDEFILRNQIEAQTFTGLPEVLKSDYVQHLSDTNSLRQVALNMMNENAAAGGPLALTEQQKLTLAQAYNELPIPRIYKSGRKDSQNREVGRDIYKLKFDLLIQPPKERRK